MMKVGGVDNFNSHEALVMIGELYVQLRRAESDREIFSMVNEGLRSHNDELEQELAELRNQKPEDDKVERS
jgi:hypothetical protein